MFDHVAVQTHDGLEADPRVLEAGWDATFFVHTTEMRKKGHGWFAIYLASCDESTAIADRGSEDQTLSTAHENDLGQSGAEI